MEPVLQRRLAVAPWTDPRLRRLPGMLPLDMDDWLRVDDAHAGQMALRHRLIAERPGDVLALLPGAEAAAAEVLALVAARTGAGAAVPAGGHPMAVLGRLAQEDFCILEKRGTEHVLTAAVLCFPASWTLAEKLGRPLGRIHAPVAAYVADVARRVERLFDALHPDRPLWRANALLCDDPTLHRPRREAGPRRAMGTPRYVRSERQCLLRLPRTGAVVFSIHTSVVRLEDLTPEQAGALAEHPLHAASL